VELLWAPPWAAVLVIAQTLGVLVIVMSLQYYGAKQLSGSTPGSKTRPGESKRCG
jgi:hypothetical protein